jgi:DNA (cytosine-5)-methyltransferase 1
MKRVSIQRQQVDGEYIDLKLWQEIILLKNFARKDTKWIVENVKPYYEPFIQPSFKIGRHCFWCNFMISPIEHKNVTNFIDAKYDDLMKYLGFDHTEKIYVNGNHCHAQVLRNCVHPDIGKHILSRVEDIIAGKKIEQIGLFKDMED